MADTVLYEVADGLATITINRPEAMNAMNVAAKVALRDALLASAADPAVRGVLLTAAGDRAFCVGQDLKEHTALLEADRAAGSGDTMSTVREHYNPILRAITEMPKPVVAGVNGIAAGAGLGFVLAADYRVVADTAAFNTSFAGSRSPRTPGSRGHCRGWWAGAGRRICCSSRGRYRPVRRTNGVW